MKRPQIIGKCDDTVSGWMRIDGTQTVTVADKLAWCAALDPTGQNFKVVDLEGDEVPDFTPLPAEVIASNAKAKRESMCSDLFPPGAVYRKESVEAVIAVLQGFRNKL